MTNQSKTYKPVQKLEWKSSFSVGYRAMDKQHQILFDVINSLVDVQTQPLSEPDLRRVLQELQTYAEAHFNAEEKLMELMDYPNLAEHRSEHIFYLKQIAEMETRIGTSDERIDLELLQFLNHWWLTHVQEVDQGYARH